MYLGYSSSIPIILSYLIFYANEHEDILRYILYLVSLTFWSYTMLYILTINFIFLPSEDVNSQVVIQSSVLRSNQ